MCWSVGGSIYQTNRLLEQSTRISLKKITLPGQVCSQNKRCLVRLSRRFFISQLELQQGRCPKQVPTSDLLGETLPKEFLQMLGLPLVDGKVLLLAAGRSQGKAGEGAANVLDVELRIALSLVVDKFLDVGIRPQFSVTNT
jgi:hypothetical protein